MFGFEWIIIGAIIGVIVRGVTAGIQANAAGEARDATDAAIDVVYEAQKDTLEDAYDENTKTVQEQAVQVRGTQNQVLAVMGQAGGADTAAAAVITETSRQEQSDLNLLDQNLNNALAELDAEVNMAKTRNDNDYNLNLANITSSAINDMANIVLTAGESALKLPSPSETLITGGGSGGSSGVGTRVGLIPT